MKNVILLLLVICAAAAHSQTTQSDTVWSKFIGSEVKAVKFSPDGQFIYVAALGRGPLKLRTETGEIVKEYEGLISKGYDWTLPLDISYDGSKLYCADRGNNLFIRDTQKGDILKTINAGYEEWRNPYFKSITINDKFIAGVVAFKDPINNDPEHYSSDVIVWNMDNQEKVNVIRITEAYKVEYSPTEPILAISTGNSILLYKSDLSENIHSFCCHTNSIQDIAFSPDGSMLASGDMDGVLKIWDVKEKKLLREITDNYYVYSVAFLNNEFLIMGSGYYQNHYLHILNSNTGKFIGKVETNKENDIDVSEKLYKCVIANSSSGVLFIDLLRILSDLKDYKNMKKFITPNPVDNMAEIKFNLNNSGNYQITIVNGIDKLVINIYSGFLEQGEHTFTWNTTPYPSGTYYCIIKSKNFSETLKIVVVR